MFCLLQIYLSQFGYLNPQVRNPSSGTIIAADAMRKAIVEFQAFAGLNITGNQGTDSFFNGLQQA
jgi:matrix metalloproteinase-14 (membrane-inserted)